MLYYLNVIYSTACMDYIIIVMFPLQFPRMYETKVYLKESHYHIPIQDSSKWLCVKKSKHQQYHVI